MIRAGENCQATVFDRDDQLLYGAGCMPTAWTRDAAGRPMSEEFRRLVGRKATERTELLEMLVTSDEWDSELVYEQHRHTVSSRGLKRRFTSLALNRLNVSVRLRR
jgi:hypothetical protein